MIFDAIRVPKLLVNSFIYTVFNVLQKAISFFLLPLYTIYLTPEDYGITNVLTSSAALLTFLYTFSIQAASTRFNFKYSKNPNLVKKIWGTNFVFILINSTFWVIITILTYHYTLIYLIGNEVEFVPYVLICLLNCALAPVFLYYQIYLQAKQQAKQFAINNFLNFLTSLLLNILFVVFFKLKALGVLLSMLIVTTLFGIYAIYRLYKDVSFCLKPKLLKISLQYSIPMIPHSLSGWLNGMLDRIFINRLVNLSSVGLYSISSQFGLIVNMLGFGINQAYSPWFFKRHGTDEGRKLISNVADLGIAGLSIVGFAISIFSSEILSLMTTSKYHEVWPSVILLVHANLFDCLYYFYVAVLFLDSTRLLSCISISAALLNCIVNYFLISHYGYFGASLSYLIVQILLSVFVFLSASRIRRDIQFRSKKHYAILFLSLFVSFEMNLFVFDDSILNLLSKSFLLVVFISIVYLINRSVINNLFYVFGLKKNN